MDRAALHVGHTLGLAYYATAPLLWPLTGAVAMKTFRAPAWCLVTFTVLLTACEGEEVAGPSHPALIIATASLPDGVVGASYSYTLSAQGGDGTHSWSFGSGTIPSGLTLASATGELAGVPDVGGVSVFGVRVSSGDGQSTQKELSFLASQEPSILTHPENVGVLSGVPAVFTVTAEGTDLDYQWRRNDVVIPGAISSSHAVGVPLAGDDGSVYSVVVSNSLGSVTSEEATLSVDTGPGLRPTSFANAKARNFGTIPVPVHWFARSLGDLFGTGGPDLFNATFVYDPGSQTPATAPAGAFEFLRWTGTQYVQENAAIRNGGGCVHPRKVLEADFNGDGRSDLYVACHGYDADPWPGEESYVVLSEGTANWASSPAPTGEVGYYHGATALDVDADGHIDVVAANVFGASDVVVFLNDGLGTFSAAPDLLPVFEGDAYYTIEAADVNGDGVTDLLAAGHDWEISQTVLLLGDGSGTFANSPRHVLPSVPGEGVVLDFAVLDADRDGVNELYLLRTGGGPAGPPRYDSITVQRILWPSLASTVLHTEPRTPGDALFWFVPYFDGGQYHLVPDASHPFIPTLDLVLD